MKLLLAQPILDRVQPKEPQPTKATLVIILVGHDPASETYVNLKQREGEKYGVAVELRSFEDSVDDAEVVETIQALNRDPAINGMIVQLPLPAGHDRDAILGAIDPSKDVDDLTGRSEFDSPMVHAVRELMQEYDIDLEGKKICVIGRGHVVGKPLMKWLRQQNIAYTDVNRKTENKDAVIRDADIVLAGSTEMVVNLANTRPDQVIFDCSGYAVDFEAIKDKVAAIAPPKGSIGPLVVHFLLSNTLEAAVRQNHAE